MGWAEVIRMADNHGNSADRAAVSNGHPAMDYAEHEKTYELFLFLTKWSTIASATILVLMAIFLL